MARKAKAPKPPTVENLKKERETLMQRTDALRVELAEKEDRLKTLDDQIKKFERYEKQILKLREQQAALFNKVEDREEKSVSDGNIATNYVKDDINFFVNEDHEEDY
ncbi:hypothetical protein [Faecalibaculum rodentium]|uniref:Uncharacterized protein n=2 Tax=Faecalibaculum rodentium TaxID=1702221 RepID=A0A1Q9YHF4_9FIRM|nr:hypothetical protein [Faecalibaculum rodentium]OLU43582.1 hypothetical protein BO223_11465 [Faecalibaculum rodentium]